MLIEVDGVVEAVQEVRAAFAGSPAPSLRLGDNLDPDVHQPFDGALRGVAIRRGLPPELEAHLRHREAALVLSGGEAERMVRAWNEARRPHRDPATDREGHAGRVRSTRALVQDALGLWPPPFGGVRLEGRPTPLGGAEDPEPTDFVAFRPSLPLDVEEGGVLERDGHRLTRIHWRTFAGCFASGWLYEPSAAAVGRRPAVLCPHGHWQDGARHPVVQARCITLARLGYVVLAVDSLHVEDDRVALSPVGAMTWANLRGLELLRARDDVDPQRIGCTGASGGGQQTYYLSALDSGLAAVAPAVMVCHLGEILDPDHVHCRCNHTPHLARVLDVPEMVAAFAPRPQFFLSVTGDWTRNFPREGLPAIARLYEALGAADAVVGRQWDQGHDFDRSMRNAVYAFFERTLRGVEDPGAELEPAELPVEPVAVLRALERPDLGTDPAAIAAEFRRRLAVAAPAVGAEPELLRARLERLLGPAVAPPMVEERRAAAAADRPDALLIHGADEVALPALRWRGRGEGPELLLIADRGKVDAALRHAGLIRDLLATRRAVWAVDLRYVGELDVGARFRDLHGRFLGLDEGQLAVADLRRCVAAVGGGRPVELLAFGHLGATAVLAAAVEPAIASVVAPDLGPTYRQSPRRPALARILLHGDLPDAVLAAPGCRFVLGGSPVDDAWQAVDAARDQRVSRRAAALEIGELRRILGAD
jgi:hypothetical protein